MKKHHFKRFGLSTIKVQLLQLRCHPPLLQIFKQFNIKTAMTYHPVIQSEVDELLAKGEMNFPLTVLAFTQMFLWFQSILLAYDTHLILIDLITICRYLLLRCLLSDRYSNIFSKVIMCFPLILRMPISLFILLSTITDFMVCVAV